MLKQKIFTITKPSNYISRDLSWIKFNFRVLDQSKNKDRNIFERLKFLAITSSNLDEFFQIRVGSLYNYIDYGKERVDYSGLRERPFRIKLLKEVQEFCREQNQLFAQELVPAFHENGFLIAKSIDWLTDEEKEKADHYFRNTIYPMLTPMMYDSYHSFPILMNKLLILGVVSRNLEGKSQQRISFVQVPSNLPRFFELEREDHIVFVPLEEIIRWRIDKLFRNVEIVSVNLFRITRNGDFSLEESDDMEERYIDEIKRKLKTRRTGRVVRVEIEPGYSDYMMKILVERWDVDEYNIFVNEHLIDYTSLWQIIKHPEFKGETAPPPMPVKPICITSNEEVNLFEYLKTKDLLLHHPYNSVQPVVELIEKAAEDPNVLAIKVTIYRVAKESRFTNALLKAAENGKYVSVLFEVKARFDEENNIKEAQRLQKAGCFVIYGIGNLKTHTKLLMIVRKDDDKVTRYVHMSSGNYNEETARLYTDIGLLTTNEEYAHDVNEFFNVITGHSLPSSYQRLITAPGDMRRQIIELINKEAENARQGRSSGIVIKVNSLQDKETIDALYSASQAGVQVKLIIRGMCCLKPGKPGLSENIFVKSIVGEFLEHARLYYFHNNGEPIVYGGSADMMVRSFERRIESLFQIIDPLLKQQSIAILEYNLRDNVNSYILHEDEVYRKSVPNGHAPFNVHREFYKMTKDGIGEIKLF
ncbi:MAG: polyphosphate kinase 1 [Cytophagaceae bacterium]|nr:polyphosphate kinase 1 [Cytophagaceae bacterium]